MQADLQKILRFLTRIWERIGSAQCGRDIEMAQGKHRAEVKRPASKFCRNSVKFPVRD